MNAVCLHALMALSLAGAEPGPREIKGAEAIVQAELDVLDAPEGDVAHQANEALTKAFPGYMFVLASFPEVDPADLPEPLQPRTLFALDEEGDARMLATPEDVLALFEDAFDPVKTAEDAKKAAEAALALEAAKFPEQPFAPPEGLQAMPDGDGGFTAGGAIQPAPLPGGGMGGTGPISVNFGFGPGGGPKKVVVKNEFKPRPRRKRVVTPADIANDEPVARKAAKGPVTNINSPTINKIMPGSTFFNSPGSKKGKKKSNNDAKPGVVAVDPDGKAQPLDNNAELGKYVRRQFGKVTTEQQARELMETYLTLATGNFPKYEFAPVKSKDITTSSTTTGGNPGISVSGKVFVKGNENKFFFATWNFFPKGGFRSGSHGNKGLQK